MASIFAAAQHGDVARVRALLKHDATRRVLSKDDNDFTALMYAVLQGNTKCARALLRHTPKKQVKTTTQYGITPIMFAARFGRTSCARLLLRHIPDLQVMMKDEKHHMTALMWAAKNGHVGCVRCLLRHVSQQQVSACAGKTSIVHRMIHGNGKTALMLAAENGHAECVRVLMASHSPIPWEWNNKHARSLIQDIVHHKFEHVDWRITETRRNWGARRIQWAWRTARYDPDMRICKKFMAACQDKLANM